jgi:hypothetical protein
MSRLQTNARRKIVNANNSTLIQRDCALDHILELTHISRPRVRTQTLHALLIGRDSRGSGSMLSQKVRDEEMNILPSLTQRRQMQLNNVEPIKQVASGTRQQRPASRDRNCWPRSRVLRL